MTREDILIENTIYHALDKQPFIGNMMQLLQIRYSSQIPTAGITYDVKAKNFILYLNKDFFKKLSTTERCAVFFHEIYHVLHKHLTSISMQKYLDNPQEKLKWNISMDLAINQYIEGLPTHAMTLDKFKAVGGAKLEVERPFEYYYDVIDWDQAKKDFKGQSNPNCPVHGNGKSQGGKSQGGKGEKNEGQEKQEGKGQGNEESKADSEKDNGDAASGSGAGESQHADTGKGCSCQGGLFPLDEHEMMDEAQSNASEEEILKAMGDLFRRTMQKTQYGHSTAPKFVQDLLNEIDKRLSAIDYRKILAKAIRKSLPAADRTNTWFRPSKRYGYQAPGRKDGQVPNVHMFIDTSGSISVEELNEFLSEVDEILKNTKSSTVVNLFHTSVYFTTKFKRGYGVDKLSLQSGGTDLQDCFNKLKKTKCDVAIFLTDGYYGDIEMNYKPHFNTVFVISKNGQLKHPLERLGESVKVT
jgi:predicted metal-dependent peptidase